MTPVPLEGTPTPYDEAERGTLVGSWGTTSPVSLNSVDEKKVEHPAGVPTGVVLGKGTATKPPARKKVSKWVLWNLWFNTYRCVSTTSASRISNP